MSRWGAMKEPPQEIVFSRSFVMKIASPKAHMLEEGNL